MRPSNASRARAALAVAIVAAAPISLAACDKRGPECAAVTRATEPVSARRKAAGAPQDRDPAAQADDLEASAKIEETAAAELGRIETTVPEVHAKAAELKRALEASAAATRRLAAAVKKTPDPAQQGALDRRMIAARGGVESGLGAVGKHCADRSDDCMSFAGALKRIPDMAALKTGDVQAAKAWAESVYRWTAELGRSDIQDPGLRRAMADLVKGWNDLAAVMVELGAFAAATSRAEEAQRAADKDALEVGRALDALGRICAAP